MYEDGSARRTRFTFVAAALLLVTMLLPATAFAAIPPAPDVSFVPVTGTIDEVTIEFVVPEGDYEPPTALVLAFPEEMRTDRLRGTDVRVSGEVRSPAVTSEVDGVTLSFIAAAPAPGTELTVRITGLTTPGEGGEYPVRVSYGAPEAPVDLGELVIETRTPNLIQRLFRAMEQVPFLRLFFSPTIIWGALPLLWRGFQVAVLILIVAYSVGIPLGLAISFMKMSRLPVLRWPATFYVDLVRGTPLLVQLLLVYFGITFIPAWNSAMSALGPLASWQIYNVDATQFYRAILVLSLNSSAYLAEIFRAGIQSIHKGQLEAARSLGMTWPQSMAFVIIPQTVRRILPTMMSEFILLFKDTSILFAVGIFELTLQARTIQAAKFNMSPYIAAAGFYLLLTVPLGRFVANLEQRLSVAETGRGGKKRGKPRGPLADEPQAEGAISTGEVGLR
ncbi:MAG: amino acid ABC transporter permease [Anaerosomatales bacterium]|nr:amino acid ABC transporter permease [Anaerosomatales bacterium]MDT8435015.1 amino acid ABC transporter permease [Anaerosomatales bacterium]